MLLREHTIPVELYDIKFDYAQLTKVLSHKLKKSITEGEPKIVWCINDSATRVVMYRVGDDRFSFYTEVSKQAHPQDWAWIDERFGHDKLEHLARSDAYMGLKHMYEEMLLDNDSTLHATVPA
jgi:hypothetical protein